MMQTDGVRLTPELIEAFLADLHRRGRSVETQKIYRRKLQQLYDMLPEDRSIHPGLLQRLREDMVAEQRSNATINIFFAAANSLLEYCGRRELQLPDALDQTEVVPPELTRAEYLRLLSVARVLGKERAYLMTKIFANTGLHVRELSLVTVEAAQSGRIAVPGRGNVPISACLCDELLAYCRRKGCAAGPIFTTGNGKAITRSAVNMEIRRLATDARVGEEKCNPLALRRLYLATQENIRQSMALLMEQSHDRLFETEQLTIGWEEMEIG